MVKFCVNLNLVITKEVEAVQPDMAAMVNWPNFFHLFDTFQWHFNQPYNFIFKWPKACYNWLPDVSQQLIVYKQNSLTF